MYRSIIIPLLMLVMGSQPAGAQDAEGSVYIIPVGADGAAPTLPDGTYRDEVELLPVEGRQGITASDIKIDHGFIFFARSTDSSKSTFYTIPSGTTLLFDQPNRLEIEASLARFITVNPGMYDFTFYRRTPANGYNTFTITETVTSLDPATTDPPAAAEYFDMSGRRICGTPSPGAIYIVRQGNSVAKVAL